MANEKVFTIKINGVKESIADITKLIDVLNNIPNVQANISASTDRANASSRNRTQSLTEEEKAQQRLNRTQDEATRVITDIERAQALVDAQRRERAQAIRQEAQAVNAGTNNIAAMKAELTILRREFQYIDKDSEGFEIARKRIEELDAEIKRLSPSTNGLTKQLNELSEKLDNRLEGLSESINDTAENTKGLLNIMQAGAGAVALFGDENKTAQQILSQVGKVMAIVGALQQANNILLSKGIVSTIAATAAEKAHTIQVRLRALAIAQANKGTTQSIVLQRIFNALSKANPGLLLASGLAVAVTAMLGYNAATSDANKSLKEFKSNIDGTVFATKEARDAHDQHLRSIRDLRLEYDVLIGVVSEYDATLQKIANSTNDRILDIQREYKEERERIIKELENLPKEFSFDPANIINRQKELKDQLKALEEKSNKEIKELNQKRNEELAIEDEKETQKRLDAADKLRNDLLKGREKDLDSLRIQYDKEIQEAEKLGLDTDLVTQKYNKQIAETNKKYNKEATDKAKQQADKLLKISDELSSERIKAIEDDQERELASLQDNLQKRLRDIKGNSDNEKELRLQLEENARAEIENINKKYAEQSLKESRERYQQILDNRKQLMDNEKSQIENFYSDIQYLQQNAEVTKNGIISVEQTRKNFNEIDLSLKEYITRLQASRTQIAAYYDGLLSNYKEDSFEFKNLQHEKEQALREYSQKEQEINQQITDNVKRNADVQKQYYQDLGAKIQEYSDAILTGFNAIADTMSMAIDAQLEEANSKLETITSKYDEAVSKREESDQKIQDLEERAKNARGGRADALRDQVNREMEANKKLADQEKQLAKEKEKLEKEIEKKEKERKKTDLAQSIVQAIATTASAVTKALAAAPSPFNFALAALVGAAGAIQVGIMSSQLAKLEDGGLLNGKRHSQGGMRIEGTNIEVEGGEYVINRESTNKNIDLIRYINSQRRELSTQDIDNFFSKSSQGFEPPFKRVFEDGGQVPIITNIGNDYGELIETIKNINIRPIVSVTDINNVEDRMVSVNDASGLSTFQN